MALGFARRGFAKLSVCGNPFCFGLRPSGRWRLWGRAFTLALIAVALTVCVRAKRRAEPDGLVPPGLAPDLDELFAPGATGVVDGVERLRIEVLASYPHDSEAFTQGLLYHDGLLFESTGLVGQSWVRKVEWETGRVLSQVALGEGLFGEGLARVGGHLIQLTWQAGVAVVRRQSDLEEVKRFRYEGEGWGLCARGQTLVMSDGSDTLTERRADDFSVLRRVEVRLAGTPVNRLNELECVGDDVYANIWQRDVIVRIDGGSGVVTGVVDAHDLADDLWPSGRRTGDNVLNGVAFAPDRNVFLVTGKRWPRLFEVRFARMNEGPSEPR